MASFTTGTVSEATVTAHPEEVWSALSEPTLIAQLTPFLKKVSPHGDEHWVWELTRIPVLGKSFSFTFTERMSFDEPHRIEFVHDPSAGTDHELAGVEGWYALTRHPKGTHLQTSMDITVELPFPALTRPAVTAAMKGVVALMGQRFSSNLLHHLNATTV